MLALLIALQQARLPTVGDTLWIRRVVDLPAGYAVRPAEWQPAGAVELLGRPTVTRQNGTATVSYPAVAWEPGPHEVDVPGPIRLSPGGLEDTLPPVRVTLTVASVLPPARPDSALPVQPPAGVVARGERSLLPVAVFWLAAGLVLLPLRHLWRRRGAPIPVPDSGPAVAAPVARWAAAGESKAVAAVATATLRAAIAARVPEAHLALGAKDCLAVVSRARPEWPHAELERTLAALEAACFAPVTAGEAMALHGRAVALARRIESEKA